MARRADRSYPGAAGKVLSLADARELGSEYVLAPKLDGIFGYVSTDRAGRVSSIVTRSGEILGPSLLAEFRGVRWMPDSLLACEVELWTEASNRAAAMRGYRMLYPFDCTRVGGRDVSRESYGTRRDALLRAEVEVEQRGPDRPWVEDDQGDYHDPKTGRYMRPTPLGWRRVRVAPQMPIARAAQAWEARVERQEVGPCEGLVACAVSAQLGAAKSKRKIKSSAEIDAVVVALDARAMRVHWLAAGRTFAVSRPSTMTVAVGDVVEIRHEGYFDSGEPRFARVVRRRPDLSAAA